MPRKRVVTPDAVADAIESVDRPFVTTGDAADQLGVTKQAIRNHSDELSESDMLNHGKVDRQTVYWLDERGSPPEPVAEPPEQPGPPEDIQEHDSGPETGESADKGVLERLFAAPEEGMAIPGVALILLSVVLPLLAIRYPLDAVIGSLTDAVEVYKSSDSHGHTRGVTVLAVAIGLLIGVGANALLLNPLPVATRLALSALVALFGFGVTETAGLYLNARPNMAGETA